MRANRWRLMKNTSKRFLQSLWGVGGRNIQSMKNTNTYSNKLDRLADGLLGLNKKKKRKNKKRKSTVPKMGYWAYMKSNYWTARKRRYFNKHGKRCAVCEKRWGVTLHHKVYDNTLYGKEPDAHLVALCRKHHHEFHEHHETKGNMNKETTIYVAHARQMESFNDDLSWI